MLVRKILNPSHLISSHRLRKLEFTVKVGGKPFEIKSDVVGRRAVTSRNGWQYDPGRAQPEWRVLLWVQWA